MMKNAFCFILKALIVLKIFNLLSWLFANPACLETSDENQHYKTFCKINGFKLKDKYAKMIPVLILDPKKQLYLKPKF